MDFLSKGKQRSACPYGFGYTTRVKASTPLLEVQLLQADDLAPRFQQLCFTLPLATLSISSQPCLTAKTFCVAICIGLFAGEDRLFSPGTGCPLIL